MHISPSLKISQQKTGEHLSDIFFRTLAESHGSRAVCVVLSGTGANGSMGLKRIKEHGGAAYVQNPKEAEFNEMPRNSIETELVDEILPVAAMPQRIIVYKKSLGVVKITEEQKTSPEDLAICTSGDLYSDTSENRP